MTLTTADLPTRSQTDPAAALRAHLAEYYGRRVQRTADLKEGACCTTDATARFASTLRLLPQEVLDRRYGCGCPIPVVSSALTSVTIFLPHSARTIP